MPPQRTPTFSDALPETTMVTHMKAAHQSQPEDRQVTRPSKDAPFLMDDDILEVENLGNQEAVFRWGRKKYVVPKKGQSFVVFQALVNALGDPRSVEGEHIKFDDGNGNKGIIMDRYSEISRLFALYGIQEESIPDLIASIDVPRVKVKTLNGQVVTFPVHDPKMIQLPTPLVEQHKVNSDITRMFSQYEQENQALREKVERMEAFMESEMARREGVEKTDA